MLIFCCVVVGDNPVKILMQHLNIGYWRCGSSFILSPEDLVAMQNFTFFSIVIFSFKVLRNDWNEFKLRISEGTFRILQPNVCFSRVKYHWRAIKELQFWMNRNLILKWIEIWLCYDSLKYRAIRNSYKILYEHPKCIFKQFSHASKWHTSRLNAFIENWSKIWSLHHIIIFWPINFELKNPIITETNSNNSKRNHSSSNNILHHTQTYWQRLCCSTAKRKQSRTNYIFKFE